MHEQRTSIMGVYFTLETRTGLINVALGRVAPELLIQNTRLVNVYSDEILAGQNVAVWQGRIAYVGPEIKAGPNTEIVDGHGMYLLPGYIDMHGHADFITNPAILAAGILPTGTTAMLTDTHEICGALGEKAVDIVLKGTEGIPFRYYLAVPAACPPLPDFEGEEVFSAGNVADNLAKPRVLAVSEVTAWGRLMGPERGFLAKFVNAYEQGKRIEGHMAGCSYEKLNALTAVGFSSCHESITAEDALNRLRLGLYVALRHGSIRADLEPLSRLITDNPQMNTSRICLTPDWMSPQDVLDYGYMDYLVKTAVALGIPEIKAIQMATVNPATYLGLDREIGGIAPGRWADMQLVADLSEFQPSVVWVGGRVVAKAGKLLVDIPGFPAVSPKDWRSARIPKLPVLPDDFAMPCNSSEEAEITCIRMVNKTIAKPTAITVPVNSGLLDPARKTGLLKLAMWSDIQNRWVCAILDGFGARVGGLASSRAHDTHCPLVTGSNDQDMALAVNRMMEMGGGFVLVEGGVIRAELPMAVGGVLSADSLGELAGRWRTINQLLRNDGCPWDDPLFGFSFLGFAGLPYVRITPSGVVDMRKKEIIFGGVKP